MTGIVFHDEMVKRMMNPTVNHDAQILETAYETGRKQGQMEGQTETITAVLEIIDKTRLEQDVKASWAYKHGWNDSLDVVVAALKGDDQE